ncbi:AbrB/MazE/SpoVT family DNA-binding domain-containing protein [Bacillaceae bacterium S4-13-56]
MTYRKESGRVTKKGQVTIPIEVRNELDIEEGDRLDFVRETDGTYKVDVIKAKSIKNSVGKLKVDKTRTFEQERQIAQEKIGLSKMRNLFEDVKNEEILD